MNEAIMTIYTADCRENAMNTLYPHKVTITCADDMAKAAAYDHVCAEYAGNRRRNSAFRCADCLPLDLDNSHSENPADWKTLDDVNATFPGVGYYAVPSRNHMKEKNGKAARPRYHLYFPIDPVTDAAVYRRMKEYMLAMFPYFDDNAKDAARFLFGVKGAKAEFMGGDAE